MTTETKQLELSFMQEEYDKKKKKEPGIIRKILWGAFLGIAAVHAGTQATYWANDIANYFSPSQQRQEFKQEFGFSVNGWKEDVENKTRDIAVLGEVINHERAENQFSLDSIRLRSPDYWKKSATQQLGDILTTGNSGYYNPFFNPEIVVDSELESNLWDVVHHEIKHAKTFDIIKKHPEFLEKWEALAKDEQGNTLYNYPGKFLTLCSRLKGVNSLVRKEKNQKEHEKLGFVSNYARTNVYEDIAELCEEAEGNNQKFIDWLYGNKNQAIIEKVKLAEEYGLIPREFSEYTQLQKSLLSSSGFNGFVEDMEKADEFFRESDKFLEKHPNSIYECAIRQGRAWVLKSKAYGNDKETLEKMQPAIREYKKAMACKSKPAQAYLTALFGLENCFRVIGDMKTASLYNKAANEYTRRLDSGNIHLFHQGINDFLAERGESLEEGK